jgi:hypothetical protein
VSRPDWSLPLPRPLTIPTVMKLSTLADVRDLVEKHLPAQYRPKPRKAPIVLSPAAGSAAPPTSASPRKLTAGPYGKLVAMVESRMGAAA